MKKFILILFILITNNLSSDVYINGYTKSNGTHVEGHYRSNPNNTKSDNWSTNGNINPYTKEEGHRTYDNYDNYTYDDYERDGDSQYAHSVISHKEAKEPFWFYIIIFFFIFNIIFFLYAYIIGSIYSFFTKKNYTVSNKEIYFLSIISIVIILLIFNWKLRFIWSLIQSI